MEIIQEENNFYKDRSDMFNLKGLLDIEDFSHNKDLDIFDGGYGKSK